ncbi:Hypothetical predicted protein [Octopus vulgaris]|uniref:Uncharacterized protein n=1 Tax=Octopus vulgaris TaxID=6645 RepID=A0AA36FC34_OCTVU|nr:Hypothetical predicted protein [Octopus vulgaris]
MDGKNHGHHDDDDDDDNCGEVKWMDVIYNTEGNRSPLRSDRGYDNDVAIPKVEAESEKRRGILFALSNKEFIKLKTD